MRKMTIAMIAGLGLIALLLPGSGSAGTKPPCPKRTLCVWGDANFEGQRVKITGTGISNKLAHEMDDAVSSFYNRRGAVSKLYEDKNAEGASYCAVPRQIVDWVGGFNDLASSTKLTRKKQQCPA